MIKILNSANETKAILQNVVSPLITESINREFTFSFTTVIDNDKSAYVNYQHKVELEDNYFNIVYAEEQRTMDGLFINAQCEHVSYDLSNVTYTAGFTATGLFSAVATTLISAVNTVLSANFTFGTSEITASQTISINEAVTARSVLLQLAALYGGELGFDKYSISLYTRRGADRHVQFRYRKNLIDVTRIVDNRKKTIAGLPTISYSTKAAELEFEQSYIDKGYSSSEHYELGDTINVIDEDLNIDISLRIVKESHDPEQRMQGTVEIGEFVDDLTDTLTTIQTTTVAKNSIYNGCSIGPDDGFVAERSDALVKTFMNATNGIEIDLKPTTTSSYTAVFYVQVDTATGTAKLYLGGDAIFAGNLSAAGGSFSGNVTIGSGNNIFKADTNGICLGNATFASAPFRVTMSGALTATSAEINGRFTTKTTGGTTLMDVFQDTYGGVLYVYDTNGNLDCKIGVESGTGSNVGGTLVLYNDSISKPRVEMGIRNDLDAGGMNLKDTNENNLVTLTADSPYGPYIAVKDSSGNLISYLTITEGYINSEKIATEVWAAQTGVNTDTFVQGDHNHGIPDGTILLTDTGTVTWVESGGFSHEHIQT
jgi:hypothetical protein